MSIGEVANLQKVLQDCRVDFINKLKKIDSVHELLHDFKSNFLGKESVINSAMKDFLGVPDDKKRAIFPLINEYKEFFESQIKLHQAELEEKILNKKLSSERIDFTIPVLKDKFNFGDHLSFFYQNQGSLHPISFAIDKISKIFKKYGFQMNDSFEIEDDFHNFTGLNVKKYHPARQMQDTFYLNNKIKNTDNADEEFELNLFNKNLLRTHTTSVTLRSCEDQNPPLKNISIGKVYRVDSDKTHSPMFHQVEVVAIDKDLSVVDLKFYIERLLIEFFEIEEKSLKIRFRPSYFPFTAPSFEVDIGYNIVNNKIVLGGDEKYMEILGSGILHDNVLKAMGIDYNIYSSIAFGCGLERLLMLKYGMDDIRAFYQGDINWLKNYNFQKSEFIL